MFRKPEYDKYSRRQIITDVVFLPFLCMGVIATAVLFVCSEVAIILDEWVRCSPGDDGNGKKV